MANDLCFATATQFPGNLGGRWPTDTDMFLEVAEGHLVVVLVCSSCKRSMLVAHPSGGMRCRHCGEEIVVPATDETESAAPEVVASPG